MSSCRYEETIDRERKFRILEIVIVKKNAISGQQPKTQLMMVDCENDTIRFVQENMNVFIGNMMKLKRLEDRDRIEAGHRCIGHQTHAQAAV
jgi:hypothetical protein